jgi:DNA-binding NtrC family response regulator
VRVIAATNRDLRELITQGQFREDLFYRINVLRLVVPPLRERKDDIPVLVDHFLKNFIPHLNGNDNGNGNGHLVGAGAVAHAGVGAGVGELGRAAVAHGAPVHGAATNGNPFAIVRAISPEAIVVLREYSWPGNVRQLENVIERLVVTGRREIIGVDDLSPEISVPGHTSMRPRRERRRTVADELFKKMIEERSSFWDAVYPLYMNREITRGNVRDLVHKGLEEARGNYKIVLRLFNMDVGDYKRFLNFLRKHDCQLPFKEYR